MQTFKTTLGLSNEGGARVYPLTLNLNRAVTPAKNVKLYAVNIHSIRLKTNREMTFKTATQAAEFIESMNDSIYFLVNIIK